MSFLPSLPSSLENPPEDAQLSPPHHVVLAASTTAISVQLEVVTPASGHTSTTGICMPLKFTPVTIKALAMLVQVLDKHPFGAFMLILIFVAAGGLMVVPYLPILIA